MAGRTKQELHELVAAALREAVDLPCRYWLWIDVRKTSEAPDRHPQPDVADIGREAAIWVRMIEPGPHDEPREQWITADGFKVTVKAIAPRSPNSLDEPPVANPIPPEIRGSHT